MLHIVRYLVYTKPLLLTLGAESGEFKIQRGLIVHIGRRLSPSGKKGEEDHKEGYVQMG